MHHTHFFLKNQIRVERQLLQLKVKYFIKKGSQTLPSQSETVINMWIENAILDRLQNIPEGG